MILNGNDVWFIPPTSRYALSKVSCKEVTSADFTFLCRVRVDWDKMKENSVTEESAVMIKNGKHLGISVLKTGDDFRVAKATVWTGNIKPSTIPDRQIQQWIHGSPDETNNEDEIHQILIPLNDIENSADISNGDLDFVFSYSVSEKKLRFIVNGIQKIMDVPNSLIDYNSAWLWIGCANPLDNCPLEHRHFFSGEFKLMGVYQKYLTNIEIAKAFARIIEPEQKPIAYYDFIESTPYKVLDITNNGNNLNKYDKTWMESN